jgi:hypothetical protein
MVLRKLELQKVGGVSLWDTFRREGSDDRGVAGV